MLILIAMTVACRPGPPRPVDIDPDDMCAFCRMAISQKQFAAEIIDASGTAQKFDDIGCMLRYRDERKSVPAAVFVVDYRTRQWLESGSAYFVHSDKLQTPMGGGLAAFADAESARRAFNAPVLRFGELRQAERSAQ
jgi:copper chaperone NosL